MYRWRYVLLAAAVIAIPAMAQSFFVAPPPLCYQAGRAAYQLTRAQADIRVRVDNTALNPDVRMQLVDQADLADLAIADDGDTVAASCGNGRPMRNIRLVRDGEAADVTVRFTDDAADYRLFVQSARFSQSDAAALMAAMWLQNGRTAAR